LVIKIKTYLKKILLSKHLNNKPIISMKQLSKINAVLYHIYPGVIITFGFIALAPISIQNGFPPQFGMLLAIVLLALPVLFGHLLFAKKKENQTKITDLNGYKNRLSTGRLVLYSSGLVLLAFIIWGLTQPLNKAITEKFLNWLPNWYTVQDFKGYSITKIKITLALNLLLNGLLAPYIEELYFRGYLLPRMNVFGKAAAIISAILFSLYHFWQPYIYLTLILALFPMIFAVWKTKDLRLATLTHCLLNFIGAILSFGLLTQSSV
jgi:uncharacterized protein